ncbi:hypothetical protein J2S43_000678 [Catenuloplanes nepalensis]|uniref:Uncharacterized protein n=1 Tax=Catenuloplanes nepalensis TaxID=587533 RepID=A0ABT9MLG4_9ACTN|nr:hypothetical protein [Catenuloplanes nepalensis]MDP9792166.1 hypothetical protein [Catenuloplanes nepalensis]
MARNPGGGGGTPRGPNDPPDGGDGNGRSRGPGGGGSRSIDAAQAETHAEAVAGRPGQSGQPAPDRATTPDAASDPPWPVADGVRGLPGGVTELQPPHDRHSIGGAKTGEIKADNTVYLRGYEGAAREDVRGIAEGRSTWNEKTGLYTINGRTYRIEDTGRAFPVEGVGMEKLDRNEYAALQQWVRAEGDLSRAPQLSHAPRFVNNPELVDKAKQIYDGTWNP